MTPVEETHSRAPITLSALEFDVLVEHLGVDAVPLVLKVASPGRTHRERRELVASAWESLGERGLGVPSRPDPELSSMLHVIARPEQEVDGRLWLGRSVRVLAASTTSAEAERAVLAVKDGDSITLRTAAPTGLPREATSVLPPTRPGPGASVSVPSADLDAAAEEAGDDPARLGAALRDRGLREQDTETLIRMVGEAGARGQFGAAARDTLGRRVRAERVVAFFDSPHGRYVQLRRTSPSGEPWSTVAPVDARRLVGHLDELFNEVTDP